jgi:hypothetical protein
LLAQIWTGAYINVATNNVASIDIGNCHKFRLASIAMFVVVIIFMFRLRHLGVTMQEHWEEKRKKTQKNLNQGP